MTFSLIQLQLTALKSKFLFSPYLRILFRNPIDINNSKKTNYHPPDSLKLDVRRFDSTNPLRWIFQDIQFFIFFIFRIISKSLYLPSIWMNCSHLVLVDASYCQLTLWKWTSSLLGNSFCSFQLWRPSKLLIQTLSNIQSLPIKRNLKASLIEFMFFFFFWISVRLFYSR